MKLCIANNRWRHRKQAICIIILNDTDVPMYFPETLCMHSQNSIFNNIESSREVKQLGIFRLPLIYLAFMNLS